MNNFRFYGVVFYSISCIVFNITTIHLTMHRLQTVGIYQHVRIDERLLTSAVGAIIAASRRRHGRKFVCYK